jgi:hypothetical protein
MGPEVSKQRSQRCKILMKNSVKLCGTRGRHDGDSVGYCLDAASRQCRILSWRCVKLSKELPPSSGWKSKPNNQQPAGSKRLALFAWHTPRPWELVPDYTTSHHMYGHRDREVAALAAYTSILFWMGAVVIFLSPSMQVPGYFPKI